MSDLPVELIMGSFLIIILFYSLSYGNLMIQCYTTIAVGQDFYQKLNWIDNKII